MIVNNRLNTSYYNNYNNKTKKNASTPAFGDMKSVGNRILKECNVDGGSLSRYAFLAISLIFLVGSRVVESRNNDERREVLTRDIPAVLLSGGGVPLLTGAAAYGITKKSGIPIATLNDKKSILSASLVSQKQVRDWYSELENADNPLVNLMKTVDKHGGNIKKIMKKFGFNAELEAITKLTNNREILNAVESASINKTENFKTLENLIKNIPSDNKVLSFAKNAQAGVKIGGIGLTAAILGFFLPHLNILITNKKHEKKQNNETNITQADNLNSKTAAATFKTFGSVSIHNSSARQTFKSFLG